MDYPIIIKNVLSGKDFYCLFEEIKDDWSYINQSIVDGPIFWGKHYNTDLTSFYASSVIKLKLQKVLRKNLNLIRIQHNAQTSFQGSRFHKDCDEPKIWTFVLFTTPYWNTNWGGELVLNNEDTNEFNYVRYYPNTGVLFPSNWDHRGNSPNDQCNSIRTTIGFVFCDSLIYERLIETNSEFNKFR